MTERNLSNGWLGKRKLMEYTVAFFMIGIFIWWMDAYPYKSYLESEVEHYLWCRRVGASVDGLFHWTNDQFWGIGYLMIAIAVYSIVIVHRESFSEHWHLTLRRIPGYRRTYLWSKLRIVLFPVVLYPVYEGIHIVNRWAKLQNALKDFPEKWRTEVLDDTRILFHETPMWEVMLCLALLAVSMLLLSFTLRNRKKDIPGFLIATVGAVLPILFLADAVTFKTGWITAAVQVGMLGCVSLFLVRHGFQKL